MKIIWARICPSGLFSGAQTPPRHVFQYAEPWQADMKPDSRRVGANRNNRGIPLERFLMQLACAVPLRPVDADHPSSNDTHMYEIMSFRHTTGLPSYSQPELHRHFFAVDRSNDKRTSAKSDLKLFFVRLKMPRGYLRRLASGQGVGPGHSCSLTLQNRMRSVNSKVTREGECTGCFHRPTRSQAIETARGGNAGY